MSNCHWGGGSLAYWRDNSQLLGGVSKRVFFSSTRSNRSLYPDATRDPHMEGPDPQIRMVLRDQGAVWSVWVLYMSTQ